LKTSLILDGGHWNVPICDKFQHVLQRTLGSKTRMALLINQKGGKMRSSNARFAIDPIYPPKESQRETKPVT
jgi:hypothetical protein